MHMTPFQTLSVAALAAVSIPALAGAQVALSDAHADIGIAFEDGAWDLHIHDEDTDIEYEADEAFYLADFADGANLARPAGSEFDFFGNDAGDDLFVLTSDPQPGLPFIGWATEEIEPGVFDGAISLNLVGARGPGDVTVYSANLGGVTPLFTTSDGFDDSDLMLLQQGSHTHFNIAFTELGSYELDLVATGDLIGGGTSSSDVTTYSFTVVPEPTSVALLGLGGLGLIRRRRA